jgi:hypothetical protein
MIGEFHLIGGSKFCIMVDRSSVVLLKNHLYLRRSELKLLDRSLLFGVIPALAGPHP